MNLSSVFFDRDGTIIYDKHYLHDPDQVELIPRAGYALHRLTELGIKTFLVSNQSGIGRGLFASKELHDCQRRLQQMLLQEGTYFTDMRCCPHAPENSCSCRKPAIGMWKELSAEHGLDAKHCAMIGDKLEDLQFGRNAGMPVCILVLTGKGSRTADALGLNVTQIARGITRIPLMPQENHDDNQQCNFFVAADIAEAVDGLLSLPFDVRSS